jgi:hypothetical protein
LFIVLFQDLTCLTAPEEEIKFVRGNADGIGKLLETVLDRMVAFARQCCWQGSDHVVPLQVSQYVSVEDRKVAVPDVSQKV